MKPRTNDRLSAILLIAFIGLPMANSLWIPVPRTSNRLSHLFRTFKGPKRSGGLLPYPTLMKRDSGLVAPVLEAESASSNGAVPYVLESAAWAEEPESEPLQQEWGAAPEVDLVADDQDTDDVEQNWPVTPRACLVLMKILHAQTAEIMEHGKSDADFYEAASYYQPAIGTISKCMEMADRGYEGVLD